MYILYDNEIDNVCTLLPSPLIRMLTSYHFGRMLIQGYIQQIGAKK